MAASNFSSLRSSRQAALAKLNDEIKKEGTKQGADERFWKLTVDQKTKVGYARLRFLPAPVGEDVPWQRVWSHAFKMNGGWFIENCPTTLGNRPCPVCEANNKLWNAPGADKDGSQDVARERKRKLQYISNILVIEDPAHPENNGKVFLFKYGKKIQEKIQELVNPSFPDKKPSNPFDMWNEEDAGGSDFKLKAQQKDGYQNYDKSEFTDTQELFEGDDKAKELVWGKEYPLLEFVSEKQFKNYDDIEKRFLKVTTGQQDTPRTAAEAVKQTEPTAEDAASLAAEIDAREASTAKKTTARKTKATPPPPPEPDIDAEDEKKVKAFFGEMLGDADADA
jgi:hypothetical protein